MTERPEDTARCERLHEAVKLKKAKLKVMQTGVKSNNDKPMAIFGEVLSGQDPRDLFGMKNAKWTLIDTGITDDEDGQIWDWYMWYCPTGPPCDFLEALKKR